MLSQVALFGYLWALEQGGWALALVHAAVFGLYYVLWTAFYLLYEERTTARKKKKKKAADAE